MASSRPTCSLTTSICVMTVSGGASSSGARTAPARVMISPSVRRLSRRFTAPADSPTHAPRVAWGTRASVCRAANSATSISSSSTFTEAESPPVPATHNDVARTSAEARRLSALLAQLVRRCPRSAHGQPRRTRPRPAAPRAGRVTAWYAHHRDRQWTSAAPSPEALAFHRSLDGYAPTPLVNLPPLAEELGVGHVLVKDESSRLGLPAFKALGASWAVDRAVHRRDSPTPVTIVTATDGNHGRAVARFARLLGQRACIVLPDGVPPAAVQAIRDEGAEVDVVGGSYDAAVAAAARLAERDDALLVQDTAWDGYEEIPTWIVEGYSTL